MPGPGRRPGRDVAGLRPRQRRHGRGRRAARVDANDPAAVAALAVEVGADLVVVGPEAPLVAGVADAVRAAGIACFGPSGAAAQLEGSKAFAKDVMAAAGRPDRGRPGRRTIPPVRPLRWTSSGRRTW